MLRSQHETKIPTEKFLQINKSEIRRWGGGGVGGGPGGGCSLYFLEKKEIDKINRGQGNGMGRMKALGRGLGF